MLGGLLRVVYLFSASMPGIIPRLRWVADGKDGLALEIPQSHAALMGERPEGRLQQLARLSGRPLRLRLESKDEPR